MSDHGFHSWRKAVNLNTWLVQQGYMVLQGQQPGEKKLDDLFGGGAVLGERRLVAHARLRDGPRPDLLQPARPRSRKGIVSPGAEAKRLADELSVAAAHDARIRTTGRPIVRAVYKRDDVYTGEFLQNASELQVGMEDGYRVSWQTTLGGSPQGIVYPNMKKWSGDHGGYDFATTAGVLISSRPDSAQAALDHGHRADRAEVLRPARSPGTSMASRCSDERPRESRRRLPRALGGLAERCDGGQARRPVCR